MPTEQKPRRLLHQSVLSLLDQSLLSALNFALGILLIRLATKETYGLYAQLYTVGLFFVSVLESVVSNPLTTLAPSLDGPARTRLIAHLHRFQRRCALVLAVVFGVGSAVIIGLSLPHASPVLAGLAFAFYLYSTSWREYRRTVRFIEGTPARVVRLDGFYCVAMALAVGALVPFDGLTVPAVLTALALANLVGVFADGPLSTEKVAHDRDAYRQAVAAIWSAGRWALPGGIVAWVASYSYLYLAAAFLGVTAAADLNAARLLLMPVALLTVAWGRVARPVITRWQAEGRERDLTRMAVGSSLGLEVLTLGYVGVLLVAFPLLQKYVLGPQYHDVGPLLSLWGLYFAFNVVRWVSTTWLSSLGEYRFLFGQSLVALFLMMAGAAILIPMLGAAGAVWALIIVEGTNMVIGWWRVQQLRRAKASDAGAPNSPSSDSSPASNSPGA